MADILGVTYQDHCLASKLKAFPEPAPNDTNVEQVIALVEQNSPECIEINFNNLKVRHSPIDTGRVCAHVLSLDDRESGAASGGACSLRCGRTRRWRR